jgi:hypothetical protein
LTNISACALLTQVSQLGLTLRELRLRV